jgi:hypothetical protein
MPAIGLDHCHTVLTGTKNHVSVVFIGDLPSVHGGHTDQLGPLGCQLTVGVGSVWVITNNRS